MPSTTSIKQKRILSLFVGRDDGVVMSYFGIIHEKKLWLVTAWLINRATGNATPVRMIRLDSKFISGCGPGDEFDYGNILLPKHVIEGVTEDAPGYTVRSLPDEPVVHQDELYTLPSIF